MTEALRKFALVAVITVFSVSIFTRTVDVSRFKSDDSSARRQTVDSHQERDEAQDTEKITPIQSDIRVEMTEKIIEEREEQGRE